uniref:Fibronectin type-III domain-containing protein n=1 Tax=Schistocephalus solidus TaxID=70667 RepID=A0A0X3P0F2_SCHSO
MRIKEADNDTSLLESFTVVSPWSDRRSLFAYWQWREGANLKLFEKAHLYYYSSLDEGLERAQTLNKPVTSFKLNHLRPETIYFVCLRVLRRKRALSARSNPEATKPLPEAPQHGPPIKGDQTKSVGITATKRPTPTTVLPWQQRHSLNVKAPENYAFELQCTEAATQNWHLSALVGGLLGVGLALILGIILLIIVKRRHWSASSKYCAEKALLHSEGNGRLHRKTRPSWRSNLSARSSSARVVSDFSGNLREEDEDDEEDAIAEDDEDTEVDTGCKSSVRSQTGIYGGSGGTTSSNRHSSVSSIDPREDTSSVTPHLQKGAQIPSKRDSRIVRQDVRAQKKVSKVVPLERSPVPPRKPAVNLNSLEQRGQYSICSVNDTKEYSGVTVNILSPSPELMETKEDLRSLGPKTPGDGQTASDFSDLEQSLVTPNSLKQNSQLRKDRVNGYSVCEVNVLGSIGQSSARRKTIAVFHEPLLCPGIERGCTSQRQSVVENHLIRNPLFSPVEMPEQAACLSCQSPAPLFDPKMVNLEPPLLLSPLCQPSGCFFEETWIKSPHIEYSPLSQPVDNASGLSSGVCSPVTSSIDSPLSRKSSSSFDLDLQSTDYYTEQNIYAEFIETI